MRLQFVPILQPIQLLLVAVFWWIISRVEAPRIPWVVIAAPAPAVALLIQRPSSPARVMVWMDPLTALAFMGPIRVVLMALNSFVPYSLRAAPIITTPRARVRTRSSSL